MPRKYVQGSVRKRLSAYLVRKKNGCLEWVGAKNKAGYGKISIGGKQFDVHRVVYQMMNGPIPPGICVCHVCDNPSCADLDHLFAGSYSDNMQDALSKGRPVGRPSRRRK